MAWVEELGTAIERPHEPSDLCVPKVDNGEARIDDEVTEPENDDRSLVQIWLDLVGEALMPLPGFDLRETSTSTAVNSPDHGTQRCSMDRHFEIPRAAGRNLPPLKHPEVPTPHAIVGSDCFHAPDVCEQEHSFLGLTPYSQLLPEPQADVPVWAFAAPPEPDPFQFLLGFRPCVLPASFPFCHHEVKSGPRPSPPVPPDLLAQDVGVTHSDTYNETYSNALEEAYNTMGMMSMLVSNDRVTPVSWRIRSALASMPASTRPAVGKKLWSWGLRGHYRRIFGDALVEHSAETSAIVWKEAETPAFRHRARTGSIGILPLAPSPGLDVSAVKYFA